MSLLEKPHSAGFGLSLLTLLKSAAGDKVDQDNAQHNGHKIKGHTHKGSEQTSEDAKTSTFTADMLRSLPDGENHDAMNKIADRSSYVAEEESIESKEEHESEDIKDDDGVFGHSIEESGQQLTPEKQFKIFLNLFGPSEVEDLLESEERYVSLFYLQNEVIY